jgi:hypothetical protein
MLELVKVSATHVFTGKKMDFVFLINRKKGERLVDPILESLDMSGMHIHKVIKMRTRKRTMLISRTDKK